MHDGSIFAAAELTREGYERFLSRYSGYQGCHRYMASRQVHICREKFSFNAYMAAAVDLLFLDMGTDDPEDDRVLLVDYY